MNSVAHCGGSMAGRFIHSLVGTDASSERASSRPRWKQDVIRKSEPITREAARSASL